MQRARRSLVPVVLLAAALIPLGAASASAGTTLSLTTFYDMVVDGTNGHVFVSGGSGHDSVVVLDFDGNVVTTIGSIPGASGMVLVGSTLYVAAAGGARIDTIDAAADPPVKSGTVSIGSYSAPRALRYAGGRLFFSAGSCGSSDILVASVNTDGSDPRDAGMDDLFYCPWLATSPTDPNAVFAFERGLSPATVYRYDVSSLPASLVDSERNIGDSGNMQDLAVEANGENIVTASGSPYEFPEFRIADFAALQTYTANPYPTAVDAVGGYVAGGANGIYNPDVYLYEIGTATPVYTYDFGTTEQTVKPAGIALAPDASRIFAVTGSSGANVQFHVLNPNATPTSLTVSVSNRTVKYGASVTVTAHLSDWATNRTVRIYEKPYGDSSGNLIGQGEVNLSGNLSATFKPARRTDVYAEYDGDGTYLEATSASVTIKVRAIATGRLSGNYGTSGRYKLYRDDPVPYQGRVKPNHAGDSVTFVLQGYNGRWIVLDSAQVQLGPDSTALVGARRLRAGIQYRMRVTFPGDADHLKDSSPWSYFLLTG